MRLELLIQWRHEWSLLPVEEVGCVLKLIIEGLHFVEAHLLRGRDPLYEGRPIKVLHLILIGLSLLISIIHVS